MKYTTKDFIIDTIKCLKACLEAVALGFIITNAYTMLVNRLYGLAEFDIAACVASVVAFIVVIKDMIMTTVDVFGEEEA